ncbi:SpoIIE family protein phosphatase [Blastococcus haudaquaticus]|uniref:PAS domain S-box-containing protein n=1 Tax=Blastococcus haudaquaticus TaxID=1938745 RepID=A0A286GXG1_9ACTN|nr:SpoIIE family protein phosphatase [Blastococcus haudaquaticus]SOE00225.1 PAS domain S-box-containing protein [Blastococcus haudaquaticus]
MSEDAARPEPDALRDPHRIAAARRLLAEVSGPAAYDRLSNLAARLLGVGHAKVTIFTDQDTVVGGFGLPPGVIGGPALLTGALSAITVRQRRPLAIDSAQDDERVADLPAVTSGQVRAYLGAPLVADSGHVVGVLAVYDTERQAWSDDAAELLDELGASVVAELELAAARTAIGTSLARLDVALEASSVGTWEVDLVRNSMDWDERCAAIFGYEGAVNLPMDRLFAEHVHPDDREAAQAAMQAAIEARAQYTVEVRVVRAGDGGIRWTVSRGRVLANPDGEPVRILGTVLDVTDAREESASRLAAIQRAAAIAEVAAQAANAASIAELADITLRGAAVLGAESGGVAVFDPEDGLLRVHLGHRLIASVQAETHEPVPAGGLVIDLDDTLPTQYTARTGERVLLGSAAAGAERYPAMARVTEILGIHALASLPLVVEGQVLGSFVATWTTDHHFSDEDVELLDGLTAQIALSVSRLQADTQRAAAVAAMADANRQVQLLADAGRVLSGTLDIDQQIEQLAELVVPTLSDWCWIMVTDEQGRLNGIASGHGDPARREELAAFIRRMVGVMTEDAGARIVASTGRPMVMPTIDPAHVERALPDADVRAALDRLGAASGAIVPLAARGQSLGALGLFSGPERSPLTAAEVDTAIEIGRRAGLSLQHARLFGQQRALADALQRSMLTEPPLMDGCEVVVRYVPAAEGAEIGGDWYDAFFDRSGLPVLAIGDVVGHDTRAAAAMGQVRGLLRGISFSSGGTPAEVLRRVDKAVEGLALDTMATALVARLERDDDGGGTILRWSNAGHPSAVLIDAAGEITVLEPKPADLLLGVSPEAAREDHIELLERGATVLLYTDGLVERRDRDIDAGTDALVEALRESAHLPLEQLCDRVLDRLVRPDAEDDVAVLALRLSR